jgi:hypothetical protein
MTTVNDKSSKSTRPEYELFLVIDHEHKPSQWVKRTGLFKSGNGNSYSGQLQPYMSIPPGSRLVVLPPKAEASEGEPIEN